MVVVSCRFSPRVRAIGASGRSQRLTTSNDYNEHPIIVDTPGGDWIVYMSTLGVDRYPGHRTRLHSCSIRATARSVARCLVC